MCFGGGGSSQPAATPAAQPTANPLLPQADPTTAVWNDRRRNQNRVGDPNAGVGTMTPAPGATANDNGPTTALKKLMGA